MGFSHREQALIDALIPIHALLSFADVYGFFNPSNKTVWLTVAWDQSSCDFFLVEWSVSTDLLRSDNLDASNCIQTLSWHGMFQSCYELEEIIPRYSDKGHW